jgi:hypothetical protein
MMDGLEGICPRCGERYYGWALKNPRYQMCGKCGCALEIWRNGEKIASGYSPFEAEEYKITRPPGGKKGKEDDKKSEAVNQEHTQSDR